MLLDGMHLPLTTPYTPDGRLNLGKLEDNVCRYSKTPAAGLIVLSASGQPTLLSDIETREMLRVVAASAAVQKVLIAGVRRDSVVGTLELVAYAAEIGYDAVLVPVPSILRKGSAKEAASFFRAVADGAGLPVMLDSGAEGHGAIPVEIVIELAVHTNVIGVVDASGDARRISQVLEGTAAVRREVTVTLVFAAATRRMLAESRLETGNFVAAASLRSGTTTNTTALPSAATAMMSTLKTRSKTVGFQVLCGRTAGIVDALAAGAVGAVPPLAASAPQACYEVLAAWKDGDPALTAEKQDRLLLAAQRVEGEFGVAGIKYGCDLNGYFGGRPRLPTLPMTGAERAEIEQLMAAIRN